MSSINRDEALRAQGMAEGMMKKLDFTGARRLAIRIQNMDSSLENIARMIMVCEVHCASTEKLFGNEMDWYGILQVEQKDTEIIIKKQYKRLALLLHPDKNKLPGAEAAFKLIGEAQRILLDREKRMLHDNKRKTLKKPAPAPACRAKQVPSYHQAKSVFQAGVNMGNVFNVVRPKNGHYPQQYAQPQPQPAAFGPRQTFWTLCPFCKTNSQYHREHLNRQVICQMCKKLFPAFETAYQSVPLQKSTQPTFPIPQQNKFPVRKPCTEPPKRPEHPATAAYTKSRSFPMPGPTVKNNNGKKKRKNMFECSESSDSDESSSSESEDDTMAARDLGSNGGREPRRSVRSKRQVSYNENLNDDDVDVGNGNGEGSGKNKDTEMEKEPEDEKKTHHHSTETLPNGVNRKEKIKEDEVGSSADLGEDLSSESAAKPNLINYDDPDFNDFDTLRKENCFQVGQIWALYDEPEGLPRFYALIKKVTTPNFSIKYVWLEAEEEDDDESETRKLPVSVGKYETGGEEQTNECSIFSHLMVSKTRGRARRFNIFPKKGETWALYKNWNNKDADSPREYEYVEIVSDHGDGAAVTVWYLTKVEGFSCVFCPMPKEESDTEEIRPQEFGRFSHKIAHFRLTGTEGRGVKEGWYELDPSALPVPGSQNISGQETVKDEDQQSPPSGSSS